MHTIVLRSLSPTEFQRLFVHSCLSTSHYPEKWEGKSRLSLFYIIDSLIGLMRLPFLYSEAKKVSEVVKSKGKFQILESETLAAVASGTEILIWSAERKFVVLSEKGCSFLQGICCLARMIVYERVVANEGKLLFMMWKEGTSDRKEFNQLKVQFVSHLTYLGWVTHNLITIYNGKTYPQKYLRCLLAASFAFGLIASGYEEMNPDLRKVLKKFVPQVSMY